MQTLMFVLAAVVLVYALIGGKDDTDGPRSRSGMRLFIDNRTGLHYLGGTFGGITPRLNIDGTQMREERP